MKYIVLIDYSHTWHLCYNAALKAGPDYVLEQTIVVNAQGKLRTIRKKLEESGITDYETVFVEDRIPRRKLELFPEYKPGRADRSAEKDLLKQSLKQSQPENRFCFSPENEADDAIATLNRLALRSDGSAIVIISGDADLHQLLGPRTSVLNPISREFVTAADVQKSFGVPPSHVALHKALFGDYGDNVPNVFPRQQRQLLPFINGIPSGDFNEFESMAVEQKWIFSARCQELLTANMAAARRNWSLVKLDEQCKITWE